MTVSLNANQLKTYFPTFIQLSMDGSIIALGPRLKDRLRLAKIDDHWSNHFSLIRPVGDPDWAKLARFQMPITFQTRVSNLQMEGNVIQTSDGYFLTTRYVLPTLKAMVDAGLNLSDFSSSDSYVDRLILTELHVEITKQAYNNSLQMDEIRARGAAFDRFMARIFGFLAHDYANAIYIVRLQLERLKEMIVTPLGVDIISTIERSVEKASDLTKSLVALSKDGVQNSGSLSVDSSINEHKSILTAIVGPSINLSFSLRAENALSSVDKAGFIACLLHLLDNARDALMGKGAISVETEIRRLSGPAPAKAGYYIQVSVIDGGSGIAPELLYRAKEPFYSTKDNHPGLGLSLVHGWCEKHHGMLALDQASTGGLSAKILIPVLS